MKFKNYIETESGIKDTSASPGTAGQLLSSTVAGTSWIDQNTISSGSSEVVDIQVKNISSADGGINLSKGDPVYIYGSVGASARLYVDLADADSTATNNLGDSKMPCVALLDQDLSPNGEGTATVVGKLRNLITSPIDGSVPSENDTVYVKPGGGLTLTKPAGSTNLIQNVGQVGRVSTSADGNIVVAALLRTNDVPNLPEGRLFVGTSANTSLASDVVYVDDTNNRVGIGITQPQTKLHLGTAATGAGSTIEELRIETNDGGGYGGTAVVNLLTGQYGNSGIYFGDQPTYSSQPAFIEFQDSPSTLTYKVPDPDGTHIFKVGTAEKMRIKSNGNVGIGTTTPSSRLHSVTTASGPVDYTQRAAILGVNDSTDTLYRNAVGVAGKVSTLNGVAIYGDASGGGGWAGYFDGKGYFSGNVGIGTPSPASQLSSSKVLDISSTGNSEVILDHTDAGATSDLGLYSWHRNNDHLAHVKASCDGATDSAFISFHAQATGGSFSGPSSNEKMRITSVGNVGIGTTSPSAKTHIFNGTAQNGLIVENSSLSFTDSAIFANNTSTTNGNLLRLRSSGSDRMIVSGQGNVGIGTTNPGYKLDVNGSGRFTGDVTATNFIGNINGLTSNQFSRQIFKTSNTGSSDANKYTKIARITLTGIYQNVSTSFRYLCDGSGSSETGAGTVDLRVKQQLPLGNNPFIELRNYYDNWFAGEFGYVIVQNTPSTIVDIYIKNKTSYNEFFGWLLANDTTNDAKITWYDNQGYATIPAGYTLDDNRLIISAMASGNVGIGTTNPLEKLDVVGNIRVSGEQYFNGTVIHGDGKEIIKYSDSWLRINQAQNFINGIYCGGGILRTDGNFQVGPSGSKFIVNTYGNVGINTTSPTQAKLQITVPDYFTGCRITGPSSGTLAFGYMSFYSGTNFRGTISPTSTGVNYSSASDYRLKENVTKLHNSTERVKKLKPSNFNFLENPSKTVDGFIAHEVQEVVPEAVTGEKDAVGPDGRPKYQGIDQSKIVPLLTAALQEAISKIEQLETRIQKLENK